MSLFWYSVLYVGLLLQTNFCGGSVFGPCFVSVFYVFLVLQSLFVGVLCLVLVLVFSTFCNPIVCGGSVFGRCFDIKCFMSF